MYQIVYWWKYTFLLIKYCNENLTKLMIFAQL